MVKAENTLSVSPKKAKMENSFKWLGIKVRELFKNPEKYRKVLKQSINYLSEINSHEISIKNSLFQASSNKYGTFENQVFGN